MDEPLAIRPVASVSEAEAAASLIDRVWGENRIVTPALLRALSAHGNPVFGAWMGVRMVGAQMGFVGITDEGTILHSHITGVEAAVQHRGVGYRLKLAQRDWCLEHGIDVVTWTFDPMVARNAYFNLVKLGAVADRFYRDYYGEMADAINVGERSDRLEVRWDLRSERVEAALRYAPHPEPGATPLLDEEEGHPRRHPLPDSPTMLVGVPEDYLALRASDPIRAGAWRDAVAAALEEALGAGYVATGFLRRRGYLMERL